MLTDEKIREIAERWGGDFCDCHETNTAIVHNVEAAIREALAEDGWAKVTPETMPKIGEVVVAWKPGLWEQPVEIVQYSEASDKHRRIIRDDGQWWNDGFQVTHWRELPAPPSKETKDGL